MTETPPVDRKVARRLVLPLALAQFIASYAATNMNVAISDIADDLDTSITALQTTITLFTLTMAALMIPGSKLTDLWGRKRCFVLGLVVLMVNLGFWQLRRLDQRRAFNATVRASLAAAPAPLAPGDTPAEWEKVVLRGTFRVTAWSALAMLATAMIGRLFGV